MDDPNFMVQECCITIESEVTASKCRFKSNAYVEQERVTFLKIDLADALDQEVETVQKNTYHMREIILIEQMNKFAF
ncbi:GL24535 [Drosophila persimilis]|uniref:GL24535 n=1 Tax=Drosophila persimilis TaxID=7234 RepID=B4G4I6_DROPE|nr:GL24535 [Drosophila persimilis]